MVPCPLSSSKGEFLLPCDIQGGSWASDGGGTWLPGNGAISTPTLPNRGPFQSFAQNDKENTGNSRTSNFQMGHMDSGNEHLMLLTCTKDQRSFPKIYG